MSSNDSNCTCTCEPLVSSWAALIVVFVLLLGVVVCFVCGHEPKPRSSSSKTDNNSPAVIADGAGVYAIHYDNDDDGGGDAGDGGGD